MRIAQPPYARLRPHDATSLVFESSYDGGLIAAFKSSVPPPARRWDNDRKRWIVDAAYGQMCADLCRTYLGLTVTAPASAGVGGVQTETRLIRLEYLGRCKDRGGDSYASGYADGGWTVLFPERVLRSWFEPLDEDEPPTPAATPSTLYQVLGVKQSVSADDLKSAYRRLARVNHPDVNKEPDAAERFIAIKAAYDALSDPQKRRRYDAGLAFERDANAEAARISHRSRTWQPAPGDYRAPLTCGWVLCEGKSQVGQFVVSKILQFEDIVDDQGKVIVTSWPAGAKHFQVRWV